MSDVVIPLSVANMRQLRDNLKQLAKDLRGEEITYDIERDACRRAEAILRGHIGSIPDPDGNYSGFDSPTITTDAELTGHSVSWFGSQIKYLEFGTGATGASGSYPYPDAMAAVDGYHPDPTKRVWFYKDRKDGDIYKTHGIPPYAPMANTVATMRAAKVLTHVATYRLRGALKDAVSI